VDSIWRKPVSTHASSICCAAGFGEFGEVCSRVGGWANFYPFADVGVLRSENTSDKKLIVHTLSLKRFFGVCI